VKKKHNSKLDCFIRFAFRNDKFALGVVQIWNDFNDSVVIFAPGVVQYFYIGGSNLDP
jgi:hypothetical protein